MDDQPLPAVLRQMPLFAHVAEAQLAALAGQAVHRTYSPGEVIFLAGEPSAGLWLVAEGRVTAFRLSPDGREYVLRIFGPGESFNDLAALDGAPNAAGASAVSAVVAWVIPTDAFRRALQADHQLALAIIQGLTARVRALVDRVEDLALRPVTARLARFLLTQADDPAPAHPAVTRALIAGHLATTPETISRSLRALQEAGAIRFDRHRILIVRRDVLEAQAQL